MVPGVATFGSFCRACLGVLLGGRFGYAGCLELAKYARPPVGLCRDTSIAKSRDDAGMVLCSSGISLCN